jgi:pimeloyl-ACP methyl ester carboxylesterase
MSQRQVRRDPTASPWIRRGYADTPSGQVHYAAAGEGSPLLLFHHTPRSLEFYRPILSLLGRRRLAIALDTPGFGNSDALPGEASIEEYARSLVSAADALGLEEFDVCGSNTGAGIALEVAATRPERVRRIVLIGMPYFPTDDLRDLTLERSKATRGVATSPGDLSGYWESLNSKWTWEFEHYLNDRDSGQGAELARAYISDQLRAGDQWAIGAEAAYSYRAAEKLASLTAPTLVIGFAGEKMPNSPLPEYLRHSDKVASLIPGSRFVALSGGMSIFVMVTNLKPLADALEDFLAEPGR